MSLLSLLCCLPCADETAASPSSSSPSTSTTDAQVWSGILQQRPFADEHAPGTWLPTGEPLASRYPRDEDADKLADLLREASKSRSEDDVMHPRFFELLRRSLPSPKAQAIPLAESGLPSGCGGVKLDTRWKLLHTFHKPLPVKHGFRKPDFGLFPVSVNSWSFAACAFTVELQLPALDTEHRGRCATYNTAMLEANPNRLFALSAVTDLKSIMFLKSTRGTPSAAVFDLQHVYSDDLDVEQVGWDVLLTVLLRPSDWTGFFPRQMQLTGRPVELLRYLGHGATSEVWLGQVEGLPDPSNPAVIRTQELVCKMFQRDAAFHDEKKTWEGIRKREAALKDSATAASDPRLRQLVERPRLTFEGEYRPTSRTSRSSSPAPSFFGVLFFQPRGEARHRDHPAIKTAEDVQEAFACLEWLRELRIIHRDLSPRHFLRHVGRRDALFLIDFGFALLLPVTGDLSQQSDEVQIQRLVPVRAQRRPGHAGSRSQRCVSGDLRARPGEHGQAVLRRPQLQREGEAQGTRPARLPEHPRLLARLRAAHGRRGVWEALG